MKKLIGLSLIMLAIGLYSANAQDTTKTQKAVKGVKKTAQKVGNKTAEIAVKGKATVVDKVYKDKVGPDGQTIYIDRHSKYYWVDGKGHNVYVAKSKLKDKQ